MLREKQKIVHLLDELIQYALEAHPQQVVVTIEDLQDRVQVTVQDFGGRRTDDECQRAQCLLNAPPRSELSEYYGGLAGEETFGPCGLRIVRMLVDGGMIEPHESGTRLTVWWKPEP
jgi:hypothetical protein